jgi:tetratricopeptide (TPR) repeat protein
MNLLRIFILIVFVAAFCQFTYCQNYYEDARKEYFFGDLNKSIELFTKSIQKNKEVVNSFMMRGSAKGMLSKFSEAFSDLDSALIIDSTNYKIYYYYGRVNFFKGSYFQSIYYYNIAISKSPLDASSYDDRAISKTYLKQFTSALKDEDIAIRIDSTKTDFYINRGYIKSQLGDYESALLDFNIALKVKQDQKAYADRGFVYSKLGMHEQAIEDFTKSLQIFSNDKEVYFYRGFSYKAIGKLKEACIDFEKSAKLNYSPAIEECKKNCNN